MVKGYVLDSIVGELESAGVGFARRAVELSSGINNRDLSEPAIEQKIRNRRVMEQTIGAVTPPFHTSLTPPHNPQNPDKQIDDIHIERSGTVDGVVDSFGDAVGPAPVVADVTAEDGDDGPVDDVVVYAENEDLDDLDNYDRKEREEECASDLLEEGRIHGAEDHHDQRDEAGDADGVADQVRVLGGIEIDHNIEDKAKRQDDKIVAEEADHRIGRGIEKIDAKKRRGEITAKENPRIDARDLSRINIGHHPPVDAKAPKQGQANNHIIGRRTDFARLRLAFPIKYPCGHTPTPLRLA